MAGGAVQPNQYVPPPAPYMAPGGMGVPPPVQYGTQARPPSNPAYGVGSAIGDAIAALLGGSQEKKPDEFTRSDYFRSLGLSPGDFGVNLPEAPDLTAGVQDQYGGVIDYLKRSIGRTENQGEEAGENLEDIYGAMANMSQQSGKVIAKQGRKTTKQTRRLWERQGDKRDEEIEKDVSAVERRAKQLGIQAGMPAYVGRLEKEGAQEHRLFARNEGRAVSTAKQQGANWSNFMKTGAQTAQLEGAQQQATLSQNVADAVFALQGQIAQSKSEKAAAMMQAQQAEYGMAAEAAQAQQQAAMTKAGFAQQYQQMMMEKQAAEQEAAAGTGEAPEGADLIASLLSNMAGETPGINQKDASMAANQFNDIIPSITGGTNQYGQPDSSVAPNEFYSQLSALAAEKGIDPALIRAMVSGQVYNSYYPSGAS